MVHDFLFELGCEELPSNSVRPLAEALSNNIKIALDKAQINYGLVKSFATPRRIACLIEDLSEKQPIQKITRRGPTLAAAYDAEGNPTKALLGFAKSCEVSVESLQISKTDKGDWLVHEAEISGAKTKSLLPEILQQILNSLPIPKPMRWGEGEFEFSRPVHWALMLFGEEVISCDLLGVTTGTYSYGHRFHHPQSIKITHPRDYEPSLERAFVIADFSKRKQVIQNQIKTIADEKKAHVLFSEALLEEVTSIVEWPNSLLGSFEPDFLKVPQEALIAALQIHQKCFALKDKNQALLPNFVMVTNIESKKPDQVIAGNEKVVKARLSDAAFFFYQDQKNPLTHYIAATGKVIFQTQLGSLLEKANRIQAIMSLLIEPLHLNKKQADRAAELSKCDLMTGMVGEFPELQGIMGTYYANQGGEDAEVAQALQEQYLPRFSADTLPQTPLGIALSLADRIDTLVGIFSIGQKPSGVKDPFKLRRHALAVARMLVNIPASINLPQLLLRSAILYQKQFEKNDSLLSELHAFILERLQSYYQTKGITADIVLAVREVQANDFYDLDQRVRALRDFIVRPELAALSAACKRVNNLLNQNKASSDFVDETLLIEESEKSLYKTIISLKKQLSLLYAEKEYGTILDRLAGLREPVDTFFDKVMVMVEDRKIQNNRLALLGLLQTLLRGVADISLLSNFIPQYSDPSESLHE
jgi:glycyl-tRNA synthetase beta chain